MDVGRGGGRAVPELTARGMRAVDVDPRERMISVAGAVTRAQADGRIAGQRRRAETDLIFLAVPMSAAAATEPGRRAGRSGGPRDAGCRR
ncbi:hypothetical protein ACFC09_25070 [Streptomyces sp. NPDC056161]|uniref:hypothetical protein n=1 Tax=Streptomyces sp. NPDC056161 TaxID=3345732 RepID=UPI0035DC5D37